MKKLHILLIENCEDQIEFFTDALSESGLGFICNTARNIEQAFKILRHSTPDAVFIDAGITGAKKLMELKEMKTARSSFVFYSTVNGIRQNQPAVLLNYVQLPRSTVTMANILKNFFIDTRKDSAHANEELNFA
ncbi:MAG: hypothetical protein JO072_10795 [Parafilimonas sp.]|nr:hypothetical protein [Parafilimonas sp.]